LNQPFYQQNNGQYQKNVNNLVHNDPRFFVKLALCRLNRSIISDNKSSARAALRCNLQKARSLTVAVCIKNLSMIFQKTCPYKSVFEKANLKPITGI